MHILLVDHDRNVASALATLLEENDNAVAVAYDGAQALKLGTDNCYDTIILDVMIRRMNGFDVCRSLRVNFVRTPVLMLRARGAARGARIRFLARWREAIPAVTMIQALTTRSSTCASSRNSESQSRSDVPRPASTPNTRTNQRHV
jgi:CheY-like chemotaxis protein